MSDWLEFWNFTSADWAGLTFAVVLVALIVAWVEARGAAQLREAQARPFVTIDLHSDKSFLIFLTIANIGGSMARDVTFEITPELESEALPTIPTLQMFDPSGGIAALPPGKRITTAFDFWPQRVKRSDLPDVYEATARYSGEPRRILLWRRQRQYRDPPIVLDLGVYRDSVPEQRKDFARHPCDAREDQRRPRQVELTAPSPGTVVSQKSRRATSLSSANSGPRRGSIKAAMTPQ